MTDLANMVCLSLCDLVFKKGSRRDNGNMTKGNNGLDSSMTHCEGALKEQHWGGEGQGPPGL